MHKIEIKADGLEFTPEMDERINEHIHALCKNRTFIKKIIISRAKTRRFSDVNNYFYNIQIINQDYSSLTLGFEYHDILLCLELAIQNASGKTQQTTRLEDRNQSICY